MNVTPTQLFPGYTATATEVTIPISALVGLSLAEADPTTGNGMEVLRVFVDRATAALAALTPTTAPTKATSVKNAPSIAFGTGIAPGTLRQTYTLSFDLQPTGLEPSPE